MRTEDMRNMIVAAGGSVDDLPDNLPSTLRKRLIETMGGNCPEGNLPSDICNAFGSCGGAQNVVFGEIPSTMETTAEGFAAYVTELVIPEGVTSLTRVSSDDYGYIAFPEFTNLKKITLPATMNLNTSSVFGDSDSSYPYTGFEIVLSEGITVIGWESLAFTAFSKITIPNSLVTIAERAFADCWALKEIELPSAVTSIGDEAFSGTGLTKITIHKPENSIAGAPWGATNAEVIWTG